jgi:hypothetical protein
MCEVGAGIRCSGLSLLHPWRFNELTHGLCTGEWGRKMDKPLSSSAIFVNFSPFPSSLCVEIAGTITSAAGGGKEQRGWLLFRFSYFNVIIPHLPCVIHVGARGECNMLILFGPAQVCRSFRAVFTLCFLSGAGYRYS